jgi:hypothetical protein
LFSQDEKIGAIESSPYGRICLDNHFLRSPNPNVYFLFVAKVGCTFVKHILIEALLGSTHDIDPSYYHKGWTHHSLVHAIAHEVLRVDGRGVINNPEARVIAFCRNPYARFVSAYYDKIVRHPEPEAEYFTWIRREIFFSHARHSMDQLQTEKLISEISLSDFARFIAQNRDVEHDIHWAPQHHLVLHRFLNASHILRLEDLDRQLEPLWQDMIGTAMPYPLNHARNPGAGTRQALDKDTADIVFDLYEADFVAFGYDRDSWRGL